MLSINLHIHCIYAKIELAFCRESGVIEYYDMIKTIKYQNLLNTDIADNYTAN